MRQSILAVLWILLLSGCINLEAPPDPTRYFIMNGVGGAEQENGFAVNVGPVSIEPYLATPRMVVRLDNNELRFSDVNRWAEPLADNIQSVLARNLAASPLGTLDNMPSNQPRLFVKVHVDRFEGYLPDRAVLRATWSVEDLSGNLLASRRSEHVVSGWGGTDYQQLAGLLETTLELLVDEIVSSL